VKQNVLKEKSYAFAILIVKQAENSISERKEYVLSKQSLRSGTSIGAQIREAEFAQSKADFINKMSISLKEANETLYWLSLLKDTNYINHDQYMILHKECEGLVALLVATIKTSKRNI
jgi:four helix bundle protein